MRVKVYCSIGRISVVLDIPYAVSTDQLDNKKGSAPLAAINEGRSNRRTSKDQDTRRRHK